MSFQTVANQSLEQQPLISPVVKPAGTVTVRVVDMNNHNEPRLRCHPDKQSFS